MDQIRRTSTKTNTPTGHTMPSGTTHQNIQVKSKPNLQRILISILVLIVVVLLATGGTYLLAKDKSNTANLIGVKSDKYQALFLTNGQVYFGKITQADASTVKISDIFYLQVQQAVQPKDDKDTKSETQLIKLGEELHGPEDEMYIDRSQILFWENLKDDSKVTEAINSYKK